MNARRVQILLRSLQLLWRYRLRSALVMLSASIGVTGVVCSVNYGTSGTRKILDQIRLLGTNVLIVTPATSRPVGGRARTGEAVTTLVGSGYVALRRGGLTRTRSSAVVAASFWRKASALLLKDTAVC